MPKPLPFLAYLTKKALFWIFVNQANIIPNNVKKTGPIKANDAKISLEQRLQLPNITTESSSDSKQSDQNDVKAKNKEKEEFDSNMMALNYLAFIILFLVVFSCDMCIWILIGS
jgi:hypothetical protein